MTKKIIKKKKESTSVIKAFDPGEVKRIVIENALGNFGIGEIIKKLGKEQMPLHLAGKIKAEDMTENITAVSRALSLESGHALVESVESMYNGFAVEMKHELEKEFDCKSPSEKALVDQAVNSHIRKLTFSRYLVMNQGSTNSNMNNYFNFLSKEIDRAHRQFISTIETLKFMKQPALKVNVKTNNAFISENQQFNNNTKNNEAK